MRWSRPDIYNTTHDCMRHMTLAGRTHYNAIVCIMDYCLITPERGLVLKPYGDWDGINTYYEFEVMVQTDSNYAKCLDTRRSMTGSVVYLNGALVTFRSLENVEFANYRSRAECSSYGCARCIAHKKHTEITWTESQVTYIG